MYTDDKRIVLTLDAGGTNFVFSAICGNKEIVSPLCRPAEPTDLDRCYTAMVEGFRTIIARLDRRPAAISFAFPGPADYTRGVIGRLPNLPAFTGGVALGPYLERVFGIPVFINNDGALFAYGEALCGTLPAVNKALAEIGSARRYRNLCGFTIGTGFGAGVVLDGMLLRGDNDCGGWVWTFPNRRSPACIVDESVSARGLEHRYKQLAGQQDDLTPKDIFDIAEGLRFGNRQAAVESFRELGQIAGDAIAYVASIVDGLIVLGGGISQAHKYILPALIETLNSSLSAFPGGTFRRVIPHVYDLGDPVQWELFMHSDYARVPIHGSADRILYNDHPQTGVAVTRLGTNKVIALGAYAYALKQLDQ